MGTRFTAIPSSLQLYFQEYDLAALRLRRDANLIIQRTLVYGTWDEIRWLRQVTFHYWRKLLGVRRWQPIPFGKGELWNS